MTNQARGIHTLGAPRLRTREGTRMATITHRLGRFTGHVGPVRFRGGVAETEDADMVAFFEADPDTYDVEHDEQPDLHDLRDVADEFGVDLHDDDPED